jgi:hypothetical protein
MTGQKRDSILLQSGVAALSVPPLLFVACHLCVAENSKKKKIRGNQVEIELTLWSTDK